MTDMLWTIEHVLRTAELIMWAIETGNVVHKTCSVRQQKCGNVSLAMGNYKGEIQVGAGPDLFEKRWPRLV